MLMFANFCLWNRKEIVPKSNLDYFLPLEQQGNVPKSDFGAFSRDGPRVVADRGQGPGANRMAGGQQSSSL